MFLPSTITLQPGDTGDFVRELQRRLAQRDLLGETSITGFFDGITTDAVRNFQSLSGLKADGIAGPATLRRLNRIGDTSGNTDEETHYSSDDARQEQLHREQLQASYEESLALGKSMDHQFGQSGITDPLRNPDGSTIDELRAKALEKGEGREGHALWQSEFKQPGQDKLAENMQKMEGQELAARHMQIALNNQTMDRDPSLANTREHSRTPQDDMHRNPAHAKQAQDITQDNARQKSGPDEKGDKNTPRDATAQVETHKGTGRPGDEKQTALDAKQQANGHATGLHPTQPNGVNGQANALQPAQPQTQQAGWQQNHQQGVQPDHKQWQQPDRQQTAQQQPDRQQQASLQPRDQQIAARAQEPRVQELRIQDPSMRRTESQLDRGSQQESRHEGHHLHDRGVRDIGMRGMAIGNLSPSQTPQVGTGQQIAAGGGR